MHVAQKHNFHSERKRTMPEMITHITPLAVQGERGCSGRVSCDPGVLDFDRMGHVTWYCHFIFVGVRMEGDTSLESKDESSSSTLVSEDEGELLEQTMIDSGLKRVRARIRLPSPYRPRTRWHVCVV